MSTIELFIGYSHEDQEWKDKIEKFLRVLENSEHVNFHAWSDSEIKKGEKWEDEINKAIQNAEVALLLISTDFLISEFIMNKEVPQILEEAEKGQLVIVPFVVRPCLWENFDWIKDTQGYVDNTKALSGLSDYDTEMRILELVQEISRMITDSRMATDNEVKEMGESLESVKAKQGWEQPDRSGSLTKGIFLTNAGVTNLIENSINNSNRVLGLLLIFQTKIQQTWFVVTETHFYCVLDDEKTSAGKRQIQWKILLDKTEPIRTKRRENRKFTGLVDIGNKWNWLYSYKLHPDEDIFKTSIRQMIEQARAS